MPELEYALLCDYVRAEGGIAHIVAANIDTVYARDVPTGRNIGILAVVAFSQEELEAQHPIRITFRNEAGDTLAEIRADVQPERAQDVPESWPARASLAANFGVFFPEYGTYSFAIYIGERRRRPQKTLAMRIVPQPHT
jgi:hypothetical protein